MRRKRAGPTFAEERLFYYVGMGGTLDQGVVVVNVATKEIRRWSRAGNTMFSIPQRFDNRLLFSASPSWGLCCRNSRLYTYRARVLSLPKRHGRNRTSFQG